VAGGAPEIGSFPIDTLTALTSGPRDERGDSHTYLEHAHVLCKRASTARAEPLPHSLRLYIMPGLENLLNGSV
jgi:hypothetical protein